MTSRKASLLPRPPEVTLPAYAGFALTITSLPWVVALKPKLGGRLPSSLVTMPWTWPGSPLRSSAAGRSDGPWMEVTSTPPPRASVSPLPSRALRSPGTLMPVALAMVASSFGRLKPGPQNLLNVVMIWSQRFGGSPTLTAAAVSAGRFPRSELADHDAVPNVDVIPRAPSTSTPPLRARTLTAAPWNVLSTVFISAVRAAAPAVAGQIEPNGLLLSDCARPCWKP